MTIKIDLTTVVSDSDDSNILDHTPRKSKQSQSQPQSQPGSRTRKLVSSPIQDQQAASAASVQEDRTSIHAATPIRPRKGSASISASQDGKMASLPVRQAGSSGNLPDVSPSSSHYHPPVAHRTPKTSTPRKHEWNADKVEEALRGFANEIGTDGARLTARLIHMAWKKEAPVQQFASKKDWFADIKRTPIEGAGKSADTMRIKTKVCL